MRPKSNYLKLIIILMGIAIIPAFRLTELPEQLNTSQVQATSDLKRVALEVLRTKCNVCHEQKNPKRVFDAKNMSDLAPKVYKQVFIKKRMPKGRQIRLTQEEYTALEKWLFTENIF